VSNLLPAMMRQECVRVVDGAMPLSPFRHRLGLDGRASSRPWWCFMAARAPRPGATRAINISAHGVFGIGLYLGALAASAIVR
jgi:hypothetical protein